MMLILKLSRRKLKKLSIDYEHHIIAVYEDKKQVRLLVLFMQRCYESLYSDIGLNILGLAVNSNFQAKGIGKKLMVFVEEYALNNNRPVR